MSRTFTSRNATLYTYDDYGRTSRLASPSDSITYIYDGLRTYMKSRVANTMSRLNASGLVEEKAIDYRSSGMFRGPVTPPELTDRPRSVFYTYDPTGRVKTITPQDGGTITLAYDIQGNRTSMTDPDAGTVTDSYNAFGQQISHSQNIHGTGNVVTTYSYSPTDGRLLTETTVGDTTLTKTYTYNNTFKSNLSSVKYDTSNACYYSYDTHGRVSTNYHTINGRTLRNYDYYSGSQHTSHKYGLWAQERYTYDDYGNVIATRYNNSTLWELLEANPRGQIVRERRGGVVTTYTYDNAGRVLSIKAPGIVNLHYTYDEAGNVLSKTDSISTQKVTYTYDGKNRLTDWRVERRLLTPIPMGSKSIPPFIPLDSLFSVTYDEATGNILTKSDLGADAQFTYQSSTGSHALCGVSDVSTDWGNVEQSIAYTDFGKVKSIEEGNNSCHIGYLPDGSRGYTTFGDGRTTETRFYGDSFELFRDSLGNSDYIHYLCHGVILYRHGTTMEVLQGYYDAQGSLIALMDADGNVVRRYAYDPWGRRVSPTNWMQEDTTDPDATFHIARGYTMHEHLDDFGLINMNGRVFDPSVAQFLSPDNYIQSDGNWLNYNRYAYCYNNPLSYTDPSGEVIFTMVSALFCPMLMPIAIGIDIGWMSGGFKSVYNGGVFWKGAWKGAISGMVGGLFSFVGGGTLFANTFFGICEGAATGALDAALWKESIGMGMLRGAISGAAFGLFTSGIEASDNFLNGYGFRTNESVIRHYLNNGAYQDAIDFTQYRYGMSEYPNGKKVSMMYDETLEKAGRTDMTNGVVWIGPAAIDSPSELKATMVHEYAHYCLDRYVDDCGIGHIKPYTSKPIPEDLLRDGPNGYANEIFNAGRLKINLAIDGNVQMEALWKDWDHGCVYRYTYPLRYQNSVKLHCY